MPIRMVCLEYGATSCGFDRMAALPKGTLALRRADVGIRLAVIES